MLTSLVQQILCIENSVETLEGYLTVKLTFVDEVIYDYVLQLKNNTDAVNLLNSALKNATDFPDKCFEKAADSALLKLLMKNPSTCSFMLQTVFDRIMNFVDATPDANASLQSFQNLLKTLSLVPDGMTKSESVTFNLIKVFEVCSELCKKTFLEIFPCFSSSSVMNALIGYMSGFLSENELEDLSSGSQQIDKVLILKSFGKCPKKYFKFSEYSGIFESYIAHRHHKLDDYAVQLFVFLASLAKSDVECSIICNLLKILDFQSAEEGQFLFLIQAFFQLGTLFPETFVKLIPKETCLGYSNLFECLLIVPIFSSTNFHAGHSKSIKGFLEASDFVAVFEEFFTRFSVFFQEKYPLFITKLLSFAKLNMCAEILRIIFNFGSDFGRQDIIDSLLNCLGSSHHDDVLFSLHVFQSLDKSLLREYLCFLKITIDNLDNTSKKFLPGMFSLLASLFYEDLKTDSFFDEMSIYLKKQLTSKQASIQYIGIKGIISVVNSICSKQSASFDSEDFLRQPSQSTQLFTDADFAANTNFEAPCDDLIHALCSNSLRDTSICIVLLQELLSSIEECSSFLLSRINRYLIPLLTKKYFLNLEDDSLPESCAECFDLSDKKSAYTVLICDHSAMILPFLLDYICKTELINNEDLSGLHYLLVCSTSFDSSDLQMQYFASNWFKSLCNNFGKFSKYDRDCKLRMMQLSTICNSSSCLRPQSQSQDTTLNCSDLSIFWEIAKKAKAFSNHKESVSKPIISSPAPYDYYISLNFILRFGLVLDFDAENDLLMFMFEKLQSSILVEDDYLGSLLKVFSHFSLSLSKSESLNNEQIDSALWYKILCNLLLTSNAILRKSPHLIFDFEESRAFFKQNRHIFHFKSSSLIDAFIDFCKINKNIADLLVEEFSILFASKDNYAFLCEKIEDLVSFYLSSIEDINVLETTIAKFTEDVQSNPSENLQIYHGLLKYLSGDTESSADVLSLKTRLFKTCITIIADNATQKPILKSGFKASKKFIDLYSKSFLSIFQKKLHDDDTAFVTETLKSLQSGTRLLHQICIFVKSDCSELISLVPGMKKSLEVLLFKIKEMLRSNGMLGAFWLGNLKQKTLSGEIIYSQVAE